MIRFISDLNHLVKDSDELVISSMSDYVTAYESVLQSFDKKQDITVYVQLSTVEYWFNQMAERYPEGIIVFEHIDARIRLQQLWGIQIPETVEPAEIIEASLLELELTPSPGDRFEDFLLETFYDPLYAAKDFPISKLVEILDAFDENRWKRNESLRLVYKTYLRRIDLWRTKEKGRDRKELINRLSNNPISLRNALREFNVLQFYKDLGHKLLGKEYEFFESLQLNLQQLRVNEKEIPNITNQITYVLKGFGTPANSDDMTLLVSIVSGYLIREFEILEDILLKSPDLLTEKLILALEDKFISLQYRLGKRIGRLKKMIQPEKPEHPDFGWDTEQMLAWATQKYLPYQAWCIANNLLDSSLYELGDVFATWLYDNWHEIHANSNRMVFNILPNHASQLGQKGEINLILVIDNLGWMQVSSLQELFQEQGYYLTLAEPYLSMIPSETEISKKCLLSGSPTYQGIDNKSYTAIIEKGWIPYFNQADFCYLSDPGKLIGLHEITAQTYIVNYRAIDTALHMSSAQLGLLHTQHIQNLLVGFVETVVDFVKKHALEDKIKIHVVTDHGSLRIPEQVPNDLNTDSFKGPDYPNLSHRFVEVTNTRFEMLSDNLKLDCFFIPSTEFGNHSHFLCARRANRFLPTDEKFYVHGGLSPEEIVVPHLVFEAAIEPVQDLTVLLMNNQFRYRKEIVELEIGNPNEYSVENIYITTLNSNFDIEPQKVEWLNSERNLPLSINGLFRQSPNPEEKTSLSFLIRYECHGDKHTQTVKLPIDMKAMVELRDAHIFDE